MSVMLKKNHVKVSGLWRSGISLWAFICGALGYFIWIFALAMLIRDFFHIDLVYRIIILIFGVFIGAFIEISADEIAYKILPEKVAADINWAKRIGFHYPHLQELCMKYNSKVTPQQFADGKIENAKLKM
jgi:hypothetical protein